MLKFKDMKACKTLLLLSLLLFCQVIWAQTVDSSITIKVTNESYIVSGVVRSEYVRNEVVEQIKARFGAKADFKRLTIQPDAQSFQTGWQAQLETALLKIKDGKSGVFVFGNQVSPGNYPPLPETIASARFTLTDGQTVSLEDFSNKVAVLLLFATWNPPGVEQALDLNKSYFDLSRRNVEIISIDIDDEPGQKEAFRRFVKNYKIRYKTGWTDPQVARSIAKISRVDAVPQVLVIYNGRLRCIFVGYAPQVKIKLEETLAEILDENNL